jgi:AmmeMemoRadiSam system protein A
VSARARETATEGLTALERETLLRVARESIAGHFRGARAVTPGGTGALGEARGAFVTLHRREDGELRGCIGMMRSDRPLVETVARMAVAAATEDRRFLPVRAGELPALSIEISALGPLGPIRPEDVEVGRHGLMIGHGDKRGVLLPQVPLEHGWDRETFLDHTCLKAGLPEGTWRQPDVELLAFTAEVFGED